MSKDRHYVYQITDPVTEEFYFGVRSCNGDINEDEYMGSYYSWKPEDESRLQKIILLEFDTREQANKCENKLINRHVTHPKNRNYHNNKGFCRYGLSMTDEAKRKISEFQKGRTNSKETREKISKALKGRQLTPEWIEKMSNTLRGRKLSDETKKKMSEANKGENHPMYGKHHSEESKRKMSDSHKGKTLSKEHKRKLRETSKDRNILPVLQFTKDGEFIKEWKSLSHAAQELNLHTPLICKVCKGIRKSTGGYHWRYKHPDKVKSLHKKLYIYE